MASLRNSKPGPPPVIIKKVKKVGHGGHHGGAWKVAYADFVTAMMAFFLLLWLLNVTTDVQKRGIADYFEPTISWRQESSGAGALLGGRVIGEPGAKTADAAAPSMAVPLPTMRQPDDGDDGDERGGAAGAAEKPSPADNAVDAAAAERLLADREERQFAAAEFALRQAIQDVPELHPLAENLIVERTPEGLRIQLVDQEKNAMFPLGSAEMSDPAKKLMGLVVQAVQRLPNRITITGHTDATPFARGVSAGYGNWELSSDRANASRRALVQGGLPAERVARVVGMADREPLLADQPTSPRNRRISIVLLREQKPAGRAVQAAADNGSSIARR